MSNGEESAFGRRPTDSDRQAGRPTDSDRQAGRPTDSDRQSRSVSDRQAGRAGDIVILRTSDGLRFQLVKGTPEGDEAEVLAAAIDRVEAWDKSQELGPWVTNTRPGIGVRAYPAGSRWGASLRSSWGRDL